MSLYLPFRQPRLGAKACRRGSAAVLLSAILLLLTTATAVTTLRAQAVSRSHFEASRGRQVLFAAMDAASELPIEMLSSGIRLPLEGPKNREIEIVFMENNPDRPVLMATEMQDGRRVQVVEREFERAIR
jgi:hypothetical protein